MIVKTQQELDRLKASGRAAAYIRDSLQSWITPGMTTLDIDRKAGELFQETGFVSGPKALYQFPGNICISVNDCIAHGIPKDTRLMEGDAVNIDVSGHIGGYYADTGVSFVVGEHPGRQRICDCAKAMVQEAVHQAKAGGLLKQLGFAMEECARRYGYAVVKKLSGHGVGRTLHDMPKGIYCYPMKWDKRRFKQNMVVAIESFVAEGCGEIYLSQDRWSWCTKDRGSAAQYEHTLMITDGEPLFLT